jgi:tetratricopeptide (TPR) repeat protein
LLSRQPDEPAAHAQLAELLLATGRPEEAIHALRPLLAASASPDPGLAVLEGRIRQAMGDKEGARRAYRRAVADPSSRDPAPWHRLGLLELSRGDLFNARQALGAARILNGQEPRYEVDFGRTYAGAREPAQAMLALKHYAAAMNLNLRFAPAHYEAGRWYLRNLRWKEAVARLQMAVECDPAHADSHALLAEALEAVGRMAAAHRHRGLSHDARDLRVAGRREYQAWAAAQPDDPEAPLQVAQSHYKISRLDAAQECLEKARIRFPQNAEIRERLIAFYLLEGDRPRARRLCEEWLKAEPGSPRALWLLGRAASDEQQYAEAIRLYEQALAQEPENPAWLASLGETLLQLPGEDAVPRAVSALARAANGAADEPRWRLALAQGLQRLGRHPDARRQILRALDLDPHRSDAYNQVVQIARLERADGPLRLYAGLVRDVEARLREEQALWRATWERPGDAAAYVALADFQIRNRDLRAAEGQLSEALRLRPGSQEISARLARVRGVLAVQ